jgi:LmbE family N-acetylglucosaminyl deacetylase
VLSLSKTRSEVFVPDGIDAAKALSRTTHLGIGAHPDDLEIMAIHGILACYESDSAWFTGVVATDGGSSVAGEAARSSSLGAPATKRGDGEAELTERRRAEQKRAAELGKHGALVLLDHSSGAVKDLGDSAIVEDLVTVLRAAPAGVLYTHNLADAHDTHVAVALAVIAACRRLGDAERPRRVIGCEVWRDLDWLSGDAKLAMPLGDREELEGALIRVFGSQLERRKRFDVGALGRRRANATFSDIHRADDHAAVVWGMDLTPAARGDVEPAELVKSHLRAFELDVEERLRRFGR